VENNWPSNADTAPLEMATGSRWEAARPVFGILYQTMLRGSNAASGFYANHSTGGNTWYNNTSYSNGTQYTCWLAVSIPPAT